MREELMSSFQLLGQTITQATDEERKALSQMFSYKRHGRDFFRNVVEIQDSATPGWSRTVREAAAVRETYVRAHADHPTTRTIMNLNGVTDQSMFRRTTIDGLHKAGMALARETVLGTPRFPD